MGDISDQETDQRIHNSTNGTITGTIAQRILHFTTIAPGESDHIRELCERVAEKAENASEAAAQIQHELQFGDPAAQLEAARLWQTLLRDSSEPFTALTAEDEFLQAVVGVIHARHTLPLVATRLRDVLACAAQLHPRSSFARTWLRLSLRPQSVRDTPHLELSSSSIVVPNHDLHADGARTPSPDPIPRSEIAELVGEIVGFGPESIGRTQRLCNLVSTSDKNARDAASALRRVFKYCRVVSSVVLAAKLWATMLRSSGNVFVERTARPKFLRVIGVLCDRDSTPLVLRELLRRILAGAAYSFPLADRGGFIRSWEHVKPSDAPVDGIPFDPQDDIFYSAPPVVLLEGSNSSSPSRCRHHPVHADQESVSTFQPTRSPSPPTPSPGERGVLLRLSELPRLEAECTLAQSNAHMLYQALDKASLEALLPDKPIQDLRTRCQSNHDWAADWIPWAKNTAALSREEVEQPLMHVETPAEQVLAKLLLTQEELAGALRRFDELFVVTWFNGGPSRSAVDYGARQPRYEVTGAHPGIRAHQVTGPLSWPSLLPQPTRGALGAPQSNLTPTSALWLGEEMLPSAAGHIHPSWSTTVLGSENDAVFDPNNPDHLAAKLALGRSDDLYSFSTFNSIML